jgi:hypothetical protein
MVLILTADSAIKNCAELRIKNSRTQSTHS